MALSKIYVNFFLSLQKTVNTIQPSSNIDGTSFTLYKQGNEYNNIIKIDQLLSLSEKIETIIAVAASKSLPPGYSYFIDTSDGNKIKSSTQWFIL